MAVKRPTTARVFRRRSLIELARTSVAESNGDHGPRSSNHLPTAFAPQAARCRIPSRVRAQPGARLGAGRAASSRPGAVPGCQPAANHVEHAASVAYLSSADALTPPRRFALRTHTPRSLPPDRAAKCLMRMSSSAHVELSPAS
jgi:hypothetical protein